MKIRIAHEGTTLRWTTSSAGATGDIGGPLSSAVIARRTPLPKACRRACETRAPGDGPRSPVAEMRTAGMPSSLSGPCSVSEPGAAKRIHWTSARGPPGSPPSSARSDSCTVRCSRSGAIPRSSDQPATNGRRVDRDARSPSTIAASTGWPPSTLAMSRVLVVPAEPDVETMRERALRAPRRAEHAGELEQPLGRRQRRDRAGRGGVARRDDEEPPVQRSRALGDDGPQIALAVGRDLRARLAAHVEPEPAQAVGDVRRERLVVRAAGPAIGVAGREAVASLELLPGPVAIERDWCESRPDRPRTVLEGERDQDEREQRRDQRSTIDPRVEHAR